MLAARPPTSIAIFPAQPLAHLQSQSSSSSLPTLQSHASNASSPDTTDSTSAPIQTHPPITRQWTLQPRPKPGRKPALDTPPTKRKAQNREAQRAFRERRAQRVGELEEHIKQEQATFQHKYAQWEQMERTLVGNINGWRERAQFWENRAKGMEGELAQLRNLNAQLREDVARLQSMWSAQPQVPTLPSISSLTDLAPLGIVNTNEVPESCKTCGDGGKCACMDAVMAGLAAEIKEEDDQPMEIDFTTNRIGSIIEPIIIDSTIMEEGCGFCPKPGGAACPCREAADESSAATQVDAVVSSTAATKATTTTAHSPATTIPANGAPKQGPGSCLACQTDPERRRFCQTLAGLMPPPARPDAPIIPVPKDASNGTPSTSSVPLLPKSHPASTKSSDANTPLPTTQLSADPNARISCADAYTYFKQLPPGARDREEFVQQLRAQPAQRAWYAAPCANVVDGSAHATPINVSSSATPEVIGKKEEHGDCANQAALKCVTCNDVGCAPLEVDAASVLTAMRMGLAADTRFTNHSVLSRQGRDGSLDGDDGSE